MLALFCAGTGGPSFAALPPSGTPFVVGSGEVGCLACFPSPYPLRFHTTLSLPFPIPHNPLPTISDPTQTSPYPLRSHTTLWPVFWRPCSSTRVDLGRLIESCMCCSSKGRQGVDIHAAPQATEHRPPSLANAARPVPISTAQELAPPQLWVPTLTGQKRSPVRSLGVQKHVTSSCDLTTEQTGETARASRLVQGEKPAEAGSVC